MPGPPANNATEQELYTQMSTALNRTGRPVLFSLCQWGEDDVWKWGGGISQMFRIQMDHLPFWSLPTKAAGAGFGQGTKDIIEYMATLRPSTISGAYSHPDPDFLMTLYRPTMDFTASRTEFSFWCMWSSPLLVSTDLRNLTAQKRSILMNYEAIAINQDPGFGAADRVTNQSNGAQVWSRRLHNGDTAVLLYNAHSLLPAIVVASFAELGLPANTRVQVRDIWGETDLRPVVNSVSATVPPRDVRWYRLSSVAAEVHVARTEASRQHKTDDYSSVVCA